MTPSPRDHHSGAGASGDSARPVRVLCVDDHELLIEGLRAQFAIDGRVEIVGQLESAEGLLEAVEVLQPRLVLMDIEMPGPDAFEMADRVRHTHPEVRMVFLSAHIRDSFISAAYKCGAWGYFAKADHPEEIASGLVTIARSPTGTFAMGPKVRAHCRPLHHDGRRRHESDCGDDPAPATPLNALTPREMEIMRLIGKGLTRTQIAAELCRSAKTVDGHQERIMKKLGVSSRGELIRLAIREGLAEA